MRDIEDEAENPAMAMDSAAKLKRGCLLEGGGGLGFRVQGNNKGNKGN